MWAPMPTRSSSAFGDCAPAGATLVIIAVALLCACATSFCNSGILPICCTCFAELQAPCDILMKRGIVYAQRKSSATARWDFDDRAVKLLTARTAS